MPNELRFQMWSLKPLPPELRGLNLPEYPFLNGELGPLPQSVQELFIAHQIIYYRDELKPFAILINPADEDPLPIIERSAFLAYKSSGILVYKSLTMFQWTPNRDPVKYRKIVAKHGDDFAWFMWNKLKVVQRMNEQRVTIA